MKKTIIFKLILVGGVLIIIITSIWLILTQIGIKYRSGLSSLEQSTKDVTPDFCKNLTSKNNWLI